MEIASKYNPAEVEEKWYKYWMDNKLFHSEPDEREPFTVVIPPPNVTGVLHMGHMLNNTIQNGWCTGPGCRARMPSGYPDPIISFSISIAINPVSFLTKP